MSFLLIGNDRKIYTKNSLVDNKRFDLNDNYNRGYSEKVIQLIDGTFLVTNLSPISGNDISISIFKNLYSEEGPTDFTVFTDILYNNEIIYITIKFIDIIQLSDKTFLCIGEYDNGLYKIESLINPYATKISIPNNTKLLNIIQFIRNIIYINNISLKLFFFIKFLFLLLFSILLNWLL